MELLNQAAEAGEAPNSEPDNTGVNFTELDKQLAETGDFNLESVKKGAKSAETGDQDGLQAFLEAAKADDGSPIPRDQLDANSAENETDVIPKPGEEGYEPAELAGEENAENEADPAAEVADNVDYEMSIPVHGIEGGVKLSELKDDYQNRQVLHDNLQTMKNEFNSERGQLMDMVSALEPNLSKDQVDQVRQVQQRHLHQQQDKLLACFPEWGDPTVKAAAGQRMRDLCAEYDISEREFKSVRDHRFIRVLNAFADHLAIVRKPAVPVRKKQKRTVARPAKRAKASDADQVFNDALAHPNDRNRQAKALNSLLGL